MPADIKQALTGLSASAKREALTHLATAILAESRRPRAPRAPRDQAKFDAVRAGQRHIYVIGAEGHPTKIGVARSPQERRASLQTASAHKLRVYYATLCPLGQEFAIEAACHKALQGYRANGEWFTVNAAHAAQLVQKTVEQFGGEPRPIPKFPEQPALEQQHRQP